MNEREDRGDYQDLLKEARDRRATDLHIDPLMNGFEVKLRIDGVLSGLRWEERHAGERLINQFKAASGIEPGAVFTPRGVRRKVTIGGEEVDCRITLVPCVSGPKLAVRLLDPRMVLKSVTELGFDEAGVAKIRCWLSELNGMFLVSGPAGSGKTTTLYTLLHETFAKHRHIATIEDPAEYGIDGINQIQVDLRHGLGFVDGMRAILRLDTDLVMIGELRDPEAARTAAAAGVAGRVVLSSLHARDAASTITALRNFEVLDHQIATALGVVVNQRLVRRLCENCRMRADLGDAEADWLRSRGVDPPDRAWTSAGCAACASTGFLGRTGLFEVWHLDASDYEMILAGADEEALRENLQHRHHGTLWDHAVAKIEQGVTDFDEVRRHGLALPWQ